MESKSAPCATFSNRLAALRSDLSKRSYAEPSTLDASRAQAERRRSADELLELLARTQARVDELCANDRVSDAESDEKELERLQQAVEARLQGK